MELISVLLEIEIESWNLELHWSDDIEYIALFLLCLLFRYFPISLSFFRIAKRYVLYILTDSVISHWTVNSVN